MSRMHVGEEVAEQEQAQQGEGIRQLSTFVLVVDSALDVPKRELVAVAGVLESGVLPPPGTPVVISGPSTNTGDRSEALTAEVAGGPAFDVLLPRVSFPLRGVCAGDIPPGARITVALRPSAHR